MNGTNDNYVFFKSIIITSKNIFKYLNDSLDDELLPNFEDIYREFNTISFKFKKNVEPTWLSIQKD